MNLDVNIDRIDARLIIESLRYLASDCSLQARRYSDPAEPVARQLSMRVEELHHLADKIQFDSSPKADGICLFCDEVVPADKRDRNHLCKKRA